MTRSPLTEPLQHIADAWRSATRVSRRRVAVALVGLACVLALLIARHGTMRARVGAAIAMGASVAGALAWQALERRRLRDPRGVVALARGLDRERADKALRALSLVAADGAVRCPGTSEQLARLHVQRAIARLPSDRVIARGRRMASWFGAAALVAGVLALWVALANAWGVLEGADVIAARGGVAPLSMHWLDAIDLGVRPPDYLHRQESHENELTPLVLPQGTTLTFRGVPTHAGRRLLLSDGAVEVPFVDDGAGNVVARWSLGPSVTLRVVARFGDVVVPDADSLPVRSIPDEAPVVQLDGAPKQIRIALADEDVEIKYRATDDHGLREVHLVLRSGEREERRVLARLDGETRVDKGGRVLRLRDKFVANSRAPVEVRVEAKDNDPLTGPKWGASEAITLIPPDVGEAEARRLDALRGLRDALVDSLAWRLSSDAPADDARRSDKDEDRIASAVVQTYAGLRVPARISATIWAKAGKLRKAIATQTRNLTAAAHAEVVKATERLVLVVDAIVRSLGSADTRRAAKELAYVADDLATGAQQQQAASDDARARAAARMDAAGVVLQGGGAQMKRLGALGRDLGEIVDADLSRVARARGGADWLHAELAARDLAARLREPDPSFGARSARPGHARGESGGGKEQRDESDDVAQAEGAAQDLERLAQDHAGEISKTEQALQDATDDDDIQRMKEEAKKHAEAIREAARELPSVGAGSDSWTSKGAAARELAEQMAQSLEQGRPKDAVESGRGSVGSLDEARRTLQKSGWFEDRAGEDRKKVDDARGKLEAETKWAEQQLRALQQRAQQRARGKLAQGGRDEDKLAERARELGQRADDEGSLPQPAVEAIQDAERAMRSAARSLEQGDADRGMEKQLEAQRHLEQAQQKLEGEDNEERQNRSAQGDKEGGGSLGSVPIPPKGGKGPEEFRRRVVRGLGQPSSGALRDAVRRYAEGLLR